MKKFVLALCLLSMVGSYPAMAAQSIVNGSKRTGNYVGSKSSPAATSNKTSSNIESIIEEADKDKDGILSEEEYLELLKRLIDIYLNEDMDKDTADSYLRAIRNMLEFFKSGGKGGETRYIPH